MRKNPSPLQHHSLANSKRPPDFDGTARITASLTLTKISMLLCDTYKHDLSSSVEKKPPCSLSIVMLRRNPAVCHAGGVTTETCFPIGYKEEVTGYIRIPALSCIERIPSLGTFTMA